MILLSILLLWYCFQSTTSQNDWLFQGDNLALFRDATQFPGVGFDGNASKAVDGNINQDFHSGGSCTHTQDAASEAFWTVDLQRSIYITGLRIYNRIGFQVRFQKFKVFGVNGNIEELLYDDANFARYQENVIEIQLDLNVSYNKVKVEVPFNNTGSGITILTLCEVQIYGGICKRPEETNHGNIKAAYPVDDVIQFFCQPGYKLSNTEFCKCTNNGQWTCTFPTCNIVNCTYPGNIINGFYTFRNNVYLTGNVPFNSTIYSICDLGHKLGNAVTQRTCLEYGNWSGSSPYCQSVACQHPGNLAYGVYVLMNATQYNSGYLNVNASIRTKCNEGYNQTYGSLYRICTTSGVWSGNDPKCSSITCAMPLPFDGTYYILVSLNETNKATYNTSIGATCYSTSGLSNSISILRCTERGTWDGEIPHCVADSTLNGCKESVIGGALGSVIAVLVVENVICISLYFRRRHSRETIHRDQQSLNNTKHSMNKDSDDMENKCHIYDGVMKGQDIINIYDSLENEREKKQEYANTESTTN